MDTTKQKRKQQGLCVYCGVNKPCEGVLSCEVCRKRNNERTLAYKKANPDKIKEHDAREWRLRKEKIASGLCGLCAKQPPQEGKKTCVPCMEYRRAAQKKYFAKYPEKFKAYRAKIRAEVISKYGGKCRCCGESQIQFLAIDHLNDDGNEERRRLYGVNNRGSSTCWYLKLRREPVRDDLGVSCHNCNIARAMYGICPHQLG